MVASSSILCKSWSTISSESDNEDIVSNDGVGLSWKVDKERGSDLTIIAFKAALDSSNVQPDLISSSELKEDNFHDFDFLCSTSIPTFSLNKTALSLFRDNHHQLDILKSEVHISNIYCIYFIILVNKFRVVVWLWLIICYVTIVFLQLNYVYLLHSLVCIVYEFICFYFLRISLQIFCIVTLN
jgi:hypothetical protein